MKKILFIAHDTSRTGAPLVLLQFIKWLKMSQPEIEITILDLKAGDLAQKFKEQSQFYYNLDSFHLPPTTFTQDFQKRVLKKFGLYKERRHPKELFFEKLAQTGFELIYANSVLSLPVANKIKALSLKSKLLLHVHELTTIIDQYVPDFKEIISQIDAYLAASKMVEEELKNTYGVPSKKIKVIYEFSKIHGRKKVTEKELFLVGSSGTVHWRKGSDLFIQIARYIKTHYKELNIKFEWIGRMSRKEKLIAEADLEKAGLKEMVSFRDEKENPENFYYDFDIFLLCSREDPFPLVAIEMGSMGKPILCFEGATGTAEVLKYGGGEIIPYLNIELMGDKIIEYYNDKGKLEQDGLKAEELFSDFSVEKICPILFETINKLG